jgi:hypothetical protein
VLAGGHVVLATSAALVALDRATGEERWRLPAGKGPAERLQTPAAAGDDVLVVRR